MFGDFLKYTLFFGMLEHYPNPLRVIAFVCSVLLWVAILIAPFSFFGVKVGSMLIVLIAGVVCFLAFQEDQD